MAESRTASPPDPAMLERYWAKGSPTAALYAIIDDLRLMHPTPAAQKTLDMVVEELGRTHENLLAALVRLRLQVLPPGGREILDQLELIAHEADVDDLHVPPPPEEREIQLEPLDGAQIGIAVILGGSAVVVLLLTALAIVFRLT